MILNVPKSQSCATRPSAVNVAFRPCRPAGHLSCLHLPQLLCCLSSLHCLARLGGSPYMQCPVPWGTVAQPLARTHSARTFTTWAGRNTGASRASLAVIEYPRALKRARVISRCLRAHLAIWSSHSPTAPSVASIVLLPSHWLIGLLSLTLGFSVVMPSFSRARPPRARRSSAWPAGSLIDPQPGFISGIATKI